MDRHHPRFVFLNRRSLFTSLVVIACLALAAPVLAEYLGPDRETTVFKEVHVPEKDVWTLTHVDPDDGFADVCLIIHTCEEHPSVERQQALCGWVADNSGCDEWWEEQEVTITLPEATIDSVLQNCSPVNGWCTHSPTVSLTGTEPVDGEVITLIEGTRNGETFACPGDNCDVPGLEGDNSFTFWAHSSWGDTSQMGTLSFKVDSEGPFIGIPDSWYIWEPLAIAVDDSHGVKQVSLIVHGGSYGNRHYSWNLPNLPNNWTWDRYFGDVVAPIGNYPVTIDAKDGLGNVSTEHATIIIPAPETDTEALAALIEGDDGITGDTRAEATNAPESSDGDTSAPALEPETGASEAETTEPSQDTAGQSDAPGADASQSQDFSGKTSQQPNDQDADSASLGVSTSLPVGNGLQWGAAALGLAAVATGFGALRRAVRETGGEPSYLRKGGRDEAQPGSIPAGSGSDPQPDPIPQYLEWLKTRSEGVSAAVHTAGALVQDSAQATSAWTALLRLLQPETSPNPTATDLLVEQLSKAASRGDFVGREAELLQEFENLGALQTPPSSINYTDLAEFLRGLTREEVALGLGDVASVGLILAGERAMASDPELGTLLKRLGGGLNASGNLYAGGQLLVNEAKYAEYLELAGTRLGTVTSSLGVVGGGIQYLYGLSRLVLDPSIADLRSNERWGVFGQALGGGLIMVGGGATLLVAGGLATGAIAAGLTLLVPLGLVATGVGFLVENWDWIGSGLSAWGGVAENAATIVKALPEYVDETVVEPIRREVEEHFVKPVSQGVAAWQGVAENGRKIAEALPDYVNETVVQPAARIVNQRIVEPIKDGLGAWSGVVENGGRIVQAIPDYVSDRYIEPATQAIEHNILEPARQALNEHVVEPVRSYVDRHILQPAAKINANYIEPARQAINTNIVQPLRNTIDNGLSAIKGLFGGH